MQTQAIATYENTAGDEHIYDEKPDGPALLRATVRREFHGELTGQSVAEVLICRSAPDRLGYVATDRFEGRLDDRTGSFVFQHGGPIDRGVLRSFGYVVPGSGTGELHELQGDVTITVTAAGGHTLTLDYNFEA
jgi:hypothetical protein